MAKLTKKAKEAAQKLKRTNVFFKDAAALIKVVALQNLMSLLISRYVWVIQEKRIKW
jgi:hypothetical protein